MANPIDIIVSRDAVKGLEELLNKLTATHEEMLRVSASAQTFTREIKNISTPKDLKTFVDSNIALTATIDKQTVASVKLQTQLEKESTARRKIALDNDKLSLSEQKLIEQKKKLEQQIEKETQKVAFAQTLYQKTQNQINNLTKSYNELSTRKLRYNVLSDAEEKRLNTLSSTISKYGNILKGVDATIGKHQRNVGNYAMQNSALSVSINQLTREMPAFAGSTQTGFMAISNNLPIFFDAIINTYKQIKALRAEGQQVPGMLKQLATSFFSVGTALSVGVTLLTLFGDDLFKLAKEAFSTSKAFNGIAEAQKKIAEASKKGTENATEELVAMRANLAIAKNVNLSYKDRGIAVDNLIKQYPYYFEGLSKEQIMAGNTAKAETALTNALIARARAQAVMAKMQENEGKRLELEEQLIKIRKDQYHTVKSITDAEERYKKASSVSNSELITLSQSYERKNRITGEYNDLKRQQNEIDKENKALTDYAISNQEKAIGLTYSQAKAHKEVLKTKKENNKEEIQTIDLQKKSVDSLLEKLENQKKIFEDLQKATSKNNEEWKRYQELIDGTQLSIDSLTSGTNKYFKQIGDETAKALNRLKKEVRDSPKEVNEYLRSYVDSFASSSGFPAMFKILREEIKNFGEDAKVTAVATAEAFQEMYNMMANSSNQHFQDEYTRLDKQKELAINNAGESADAKAEIERQYEARKKEIRIQEAKAKKEQAMFNAIIDTAQAVISAFAEGGWAMSIVAGALGALQIATIANQPIPEYFKGTDHHKGGLMLVNDAKGLNYKETIVTPDGKVIQPNKRNVLMNAPKGTKVYTPEQWEQKQLTDMLHANGISYSNRLTEGINVTFQNNNDKLVSEIQDLKAVIQNKESFIIVKDRKGERVYKREANHTKELVNSRINIKGYNV
ncbi:hypothetical protein BWK60_01945 [Flavobacterium covae]|uniref:hypothetical protein n=1 Tax=Flavobacterium covae TaxID=2906076 RepID=UPI000B4D1671|nr:hypothetical protein [Flavobacterium covae]OWP87775.1 hypothetical protein BWK60_01945 [Flavobacterium covae]